MKFITNTIKAGLAPVFSLLLFSTSILAASAESDETAEADALAATKQARESLEKAELQAAYEDAVESARLEQRAALEAVERARTEMLHAAEERTRANKERAAQQENFVRNHKLHEAESTAMREQLSRAHDSLRKVSREVARVHRELDRSHIRIAPNYSFVNLGDRAIIGVVLGDTVDDGVPVLGVSPDGPSDRAGLLQGDVIVSMMGQSLSGSDEGDARAVLGQVMEGVKVGDEIIITVNRDGELIEHTVVADKREPFAWQSIVRLSSAPLAVLAAEAVLAAPGVPGVPVIIDRIKIPEIDEKHLLVQLEKMREGLERTRIVIGTSHLAPVAGTSSDWDFEFESFSEFGDGVLRQANVWFGLPVTRGLKLAEIDEGLGEYFKTDRGVLVLKAQEDNDLELESGDVILLVGGKEVDKPSDVMRALRDWEPGESFEIEVKRDRKDRTLDITLPERTHNFNFAPSSEDIHIRVHTSKD